MNPKRMTYWKWSKWMREHHALLTQPWPLEHCARCGAPLANHVAAAAHYERHFTKLWQVLREATTK